MLRRLRETTDFRIVVVDDGSMPKCDTVFREAAQYAKVLRHRRNRGKGAAIKTGLRWLERGGCPADATILLMDADGQHRVADGIRLAACSRSHPNALCLGSRVFHGHIPLRSRFGNMVTRWVFFAVTGIGVQDTQTGLRAFSAGHIPLMNAITGNRYEYEMNMLLTCADRKIPFCEMPIKTVYIDHNASSFFRPVTDSARIYRTILSFALSKGDKQ